MIFYSTLKSLDEMTKVSQSGLKNATVVANEETRRKRLICTPS